MSNSINTPPVSGNEVRQSQWNQAAPEGLLRFLPIWWCLSRAAVIFLHYHPISICHINSTLLPLWTPPSHGTCCLAAPWTTVYVHLLTSSCLRRRFGLFQTCYTGSYTGIPRCGVTTYDCWLYIYTVGPANIAGDSSAAAGAPHRTLPATNRPTGGSARVPHKFTP